MHKLYNVSRLLLIHMYFFLINTFTNINIDSSEIELYVFSYQFYFSKMFNNNNNKNKVFWTIIAYSFRINTEKLNIYCEMEKLPKVIYFHGI